MDSSIGEMDLNLFFHGYKMRILRPFVRIAVFYVARPEEAMIVTETSTKRSKILMQASRGASIQRAAEFAALLGLTEEVRTIVNRIDVDIVAVLNTAVIGGHTKTCSVLADYVLTCEMADIVWTAYFSNRVGAGCVLRYKSNPQLQIPEYEGESFMPPTSISDMSMSWGINRIVRYSADGQTIRDLYQAWKLHWVNEELNAAVLMKNYEKIKMLISYGASAYAQSLILAILTKDRTSIRLLLRYFFMYGEIEYAFTEYPQIRDYIIDNYRRGPTPSLLGMTVPKWVMEWIIRWMALYLD